MNQLQVCLKYSSLTAKGMLYALLALMPLWGIFSPFTFLFFTILLLLDPSIFFRNFSLYCGFMGGLIVMTSTAVSACLALADDRLIATREGLRIPFHASFATRMRRHIRWQEITGVTFAGNLESAPWKFSIRFRTSSGMSFSIKAAQLSESQMEQFLLALELWVDGGKVDERLPLLKDRLQQRLCQGEAKDRSYTVMWEQELESRFASTAFVVLDPGTSLQNGRLKVVRQLSFGGLSAVYLCQKDNRELVVLKEAVVPADTSDELRKKAGEMFAREARLLMRTNHPNIVRVLDYFVEKGRNYLLLEYINGQDLSKFVKEHGPQPEQKVIEWAHVLTDILKYLHSQEPPILHRDLSPDNVIIDASQNQSLRLIDFGAANEFLGTATGTLIGKRSYLPLEQLQGKALPQSDIYALGGTMHFLLTGSDPEPLAVSHPRSIRPDISTWMDDLVARCTASDCKNRPNSADDLEKILLDYSQGGRNIAGSSG